MERVDGKGQITVTEAGRRGGTSTRDRHRSQFYRQIGSRSGESTKKSYARLLKEFGRLGGL